MFTSVLSRARNYFSFGHSRTLLLRKNIAISIVIKGFAVLINLLLVPLAIGLISPVQFGIWLTLSSLINWMNIFDFGIGNGLKNKLTESWAKKNYEEARRYISTTYTLLSVISILLFTFLWFLFKIIDWNNFLNVPYIESINLERIVLMIAAAFSIQFVVQLITVILTATQESFKSSFILFIGQIFSLIGLYSAKILNETNLESFVLILAFIPIITMLVASLYLFNSSLSVVAPSLKYVDVKKIKSILNVGGVFFIIQLGVVVLFQKDNIVISKLLGPEAVTTYNVGLKLFSVVLIILNIILTPYWSAYTEAYIKKDFDWIKNRVVHSRKLWLILSLISLLLLILSKQILKIWIGEEVKIPFLVSFSFFTYILAFSWHSIHVFVLNGIGKLRIQAIIMTLGSLLNIFLSIFLTKSIGVSGVIYANTIIFLLMGFIFFIQVERIIKQTATGIWNK